MEELSQTHYKMFMHQDQIGIWSVGFCGLRKTGKPRKKPSEQGQEPTTNLSPLLPIIACKQALMRCCMSKGEAVRDESVSEVNQ